MHRHELTHIDLPPEAIYQILANVVDISVLNTLSQVNHQFYDLTKLLVKNNFELLLLNAVSDYQQTQQIFKLIQIYAPEMTTMPSGSEPMDLKKAYRLAYNVLASKDIRKLDEKLIEEAIVCLKNALPLDLDDYTQNDSKLLDLINSLSITLGVKKSETNKNQLETTKDVEKLLQEKRNKNAYINLSYGKLYSIEANNISLNGCNLENTSLYYVKFSNSSFIDTNFTNCRSSVTKFTECNLTSSNWQKCYLNTLIIENGCLTNTNFCQATIHDSHIQHENTNNIILVATEFKKSIEGVKNPLLQTNVGIFTGSAYAEHVINTITLQTKERTLNCQVNLKMLTYLGMFIDNLLDNPNQKNVKDKLSVIINLFEQISKNINNRFHDLLMSWQKKNALQISSISFFNTENNQTINQLLKIAEEVENSIKMESKLNKKL